MFGAVFRRQRMTTQFRGDLDPRRRAWRRAKLVVMVAALALCSASVAYAATIFTYATGVNGTTGGVGGSGFYPNPGGYDFRNFNRVYHQAGTEWQLFYDASGGPLTIYADGTTNPLSSGGSGGSQFRPWCRNINDLSGVTWTCQTTRP